MNYWKHSGFLFTEHTTPRILSLSYLFLRQSVLLIIKKCTLELFATRSYFRPIEIKFVAGELIMKQALPAFASAWLPPWLERRACKSVHVSLCDR